MMQKTQLWVKFDPAAHCLMQRLLTAEEDFGTWVKVVSGQDYPTSQETLDLEATSIRALSDLTNHLAFVLARRRLARGKPKIDRDFVVPWQTIEALHSLAVQVHSKDMGFRGFVWPWDAISDMITNGMNNVTRQIVAQYRHWQRREHQNWHPVYLPAYIVGRPEFEPPH